MRTKSSLLALAVAASAGLGSACGSNITSLHFTVSKPIPTQTISSSIAPCQVATVVPFLQTPLGMTFDQSTDFPQQKTDVAHITSVRLKTMSLALTSTSPTTTWDFLTDLTIKVSASGLSDAIVATIGKDTISGVAIPTGATTLTLVPASVELAPYVKASGGFTMTASAQGCPPSQDADFDGSVSFKVTAKPL